MAVLMELKSAVSVMVAYERKVNYCMPAQERMGRTYLTLIDYVPSENWFLDGISGMCETKR